MPLGLQLSLTLEVAVVIWMIPTSTFPLVALPQEPFLSQLCPELLPPVHTPDRDGFKPNGTQTPTGCVLH